MSQSTLPSISLSKIHPGYASSIIFVTLPHQSHNWCEFHLPFSSVRVHSHLLDDRYNHSFGIFRAFYYLIQMDSRPTQRTSVYLLHELADIVDQEKLDQLGE